VLFKSNKIAHVRFTLFQHNPIDTIVTDLEGRVIKSNMAKKKSGDRIPNIGDVMYRDYGGKHEIDMYAEMMESIRTGELKDFPELKYNDKFLSIKIAPFSRGAIITSQDVTEHKLGEERLKASEAKLKEQKAALVQKNIALKELIEQIEIEKNMIKNDIANNIKKIILPILIKLKSKGVPGTYMDLLQHHIEVLASSFGAKITKKSINLTIREIEICTMIKAGLGSKEISNILNISYMTVVKHRKNIRKKLGISNKKINLISFLQEL